MVRPTVSARSRGMEVISKREDLEPVVARLQSRHRDLIIQEYIPGTLKQNFYLLIGRDHQVLGMILRPGITHLTPGLPEFLGRSDF